MCGGGCVGVCAEVCGGCAGVCGVCVCMLDKREGVACSGAFSPHTHPHTHNYRLYLHHSYNVEVCNLIDHYYYSIEDIYEAF